MLNYVRKNWLNCSTITFLFVLSGNSCLSNSIMTGVSVHWRLCWGAVGTCYSHTNKLMDKVKPGRKFSNFANPLPASLLYECCFDHEIKGKLSLFGRQLSERERERERERGGGGALLSCILLLSEFQKMSPLWNCMKAFLFWTQDCSSGISCNRYPNLQCTFLLCDCKEKNCLSRLQCSFLYL